MKKGYNLFLLIFALISLFLFTSPTVYTEETQYNYGNLDSLNTEDYINVEKTVIPVSERLCEDGTINIYHYTYLREIRIIFICTYKTFNRGLAAELIRSSLYRYGRSNDYERFSHYTRITNDNYRLHKYDWTDDIYIIYNAHVKINN